jgi:hypothetical protein
MKRATLVLLLCVALGATYASASITGTTDPNAFNDYVDWCVQFNNCASTPFFEPSPSSFTSNGGVTGFIGLVGTQEPFEVRQQGVSWSGNFAANMGVVYNAVSTQNNTPADIAATFGVGVYGAGAYIQAEQYGAFTATVTLFDVNYQPLGSFTTQGMSDQNTGTALFIGAYDTTPDVYAIQFNVQDINGQDDFAIGQMLLNTTGIPEPSTLMMLGPSALGVLGVIRRRMNRKSQEVQ